MSEVQIYRPRSVVLLGGFVALIGLVLAAAGVYLAARGGSWYYVLAGALFLAAGSLMMKERSRDYRFIRRCNGTRAASASCSGP